MANTDGVRSEAGLAGKGQHEKRYAGISVYLSDEIGRQRKKQTVGGWAIEPCMGRVANGVPGRSHRLKQLGNAVVPQIPEAIGRAIMEQHES